MEKAFISKVGDKSNLKNRVLKALNWLGWENIVSKETKVFIKPNLTWLSYKPGVTTSPQVIEAVTSILKSRTPDIIIGESDGGYHSFKAEKAFEKQGIYEMAKRYEFKL